SVCVEGYWLPQGDVPVIQPDKVPVQYILTPSIRR
ncbi:unnamed protein product, partial [Allacma fusca]